LRQAARLRFNTAAGMDHIWRNAIDGNPRRLGLLRASQMQFSLELSAERWSDALVRFCHAMREGRPCVNLLLKLSVD
jgi:hypothetical protein